MKNKHLSYDGRLTIEKNLKINLSFKQIGKELNRDCTTISKEVKNNLVFKEVGTIGRPFLDCIHLSNCEFKERGKKCNISECAHYEKNL